MSNYMTPAEAARVDRYMANADRIDRTTGTAALRKLLLGFGYDPADLRTADDVTEVARAARTTYRHMARTTKSHAKVRFENQRAERKTAKPRKRTRKAA